MESGTGDLPIEEDVTHAFLLRIWVEETHRETGHAIWRGHITHLLDGRRRYVTRLRNVDAFIAPYLSEMGVDLGARWRIRGWLRARWGHETQTIDEMRRD